MVTHESGSGVGKSFVLVRALAVRFPDDFGWSLTPGHDDVTWKIIESGLVVGTFHDEFDGRALDLQKWNPNDPWGRERNRELQAKSLISAPEKRESCVPIFRSFCRADSTK